MKGKDLAKISLKALKVFLKTYQAKSPAMIELKEDLERFADVYAKHALDAFKKHTEKG